MVSIMSFLALLVSKYLWEFSAADGVQHTEYRAFFLNLSSRDEANMSYADLNGPSSSLNWIVLHPAVAGLVSPQESVKVAVAVYGQLLVECTVQLHVPQTQS